jgi:hypothetical protein
MHELSAFEIVDINYADRVIVLEDKQLGYSVEVAFGDQELQSVKIIEPYAILITYQDGTSEKKQFLK